MNFSLKTNQNLILMRERHDKGFDPPLWFAQLRLSPNGSKFAATSASFCQNSVPQEQ